MRTLSKPKHLTGLLSTTALVLGFAITAQPAFAATGIATTKHNLGSSNGVNINYVSGPNPSGLSLNGEICVFCHTPHGSDTSAAAPLWNKQLPSGTNYTTYASLNSGTMDGIVGKPGAISLACLSCHDGAQAMDNIINAPGSGNYDPTGGGAAGRQYQWTGANQTAGKMNSNTVAMLGTDLSNDHPVGVEYCGGPDGAIGVCKDKDFVPPTAASGQMAVGPWWVDTADGTTGTRQKTDMILYAAKADRTSGTGPQVECASCHDPHSTNGLFLRRTAGNTNSVTCLSCHVK
jgi:predicted CXXCH cytochrome family protein